jgi:predicted transcriptional regulator
MYQGRRRSPKPQQHRAESERQPRHVPWVECYAALHLLHAQGIPVATIAQQLGISRPTVHAYLRRDGPPGPKRPQFRWSNHVLTPYIPYLIRRWRESGANSAQLWREIQALGYTRSARTVCRFITRLRRASEAGQAPETQGSPYTRPQGPSARAVSFT